MDEDSIKVEAVRGEREHIAVDARDTTAVICETVTGGGTGAVIRTRGHYRALPHRSPSSNDSTHSTPVHARRPSLKKKRVKPGDWRIKGAYRAVDDDPHSSEEDAAARNGHAPAAEPRPERPPPAEPLASPRIETNGPERVSKNKAFRIGSAKRVLDSTPGLANGDSCEVLKYPAHSVTGDGDPDFGTPV